MTAQHYRVLKLASNYSALFALILAYWWLLVSLFKLRSVITPNEVGGAMLVAVIAVCLAALLAILGWCTSKFLDELFHRISAGEFHNWIVLCSSMPVFVVSALDLTDRLHLIEKQQFALAGLYAFHAGAVANIYHRFWRQH